MKKERVDVLAVQQGLFETREKAKRGIMAGLVYTDKHERLDKPGEKIAGETILEIKGQKLPYVSRGGLKLAKAIEHFGLDFRDKTVLDIGSSTGGFTDVALQNEAKLSYALDVGYNQLAWKIRQDERVVVMERTNFRYSKPEDFTQGLPEMATIDVSFISLRFPYSSKCLGSLTLPLATSLIFFSIFFSGKVIIFIVILFKINVIIINPIKINTVLSSIFCPFYFF